MKDQRRKNKKIENKRIEFMRNIRLTMKKCAGFVLMGLIVLMNTCNAGEIGKGMMPLTEFNEIFQYTPIVKHNPSSYLQMTDGVNNIILFADRPFILMNGLLYSIENQVTLENDEWMISNEAMIMIINENRKKKNSYSDADLDWLSKIVTVEGRNLTLEGKLAIANVVLNRVNSDLFPNSIHDVIFEVDYHVQFPPAHKEGFKLIETSEEAVTAALLALNGYNNIDLCLFFNNRPFNNKGDDLFKIIEGEYFYY